MASATKPCAVAIKTEKDRDTEPERFNLKRWTSCSVYLRRRVCGRRREGGVG